MQVSTGSGILELFWNLILFKGLEIFQNLATMQNSLEKFWKSIYSYERIFCFKCGENTSHTWIIWFILLRLINGYWKNLTIRMQQSEYLIDSPISY